MTTRDRIAWGVLLLSLLAGVGATLSAAWSLWGWFIRLQCLRP